jgi:KipI family sensor histidine kinase inhibitor
LEQGAEAPMGPLREIRVRYDGPDLPAVARAAHLTVEEVIAAHSDAEHIVEFFGFAPGVAYIKGTPDRIAVPRLPSPRQRIESGTVAITGNQTLIYPGGTPGGWHCIGHTDALLWDVNADSPALLDVGDAIRFVPTAT